VARVKRKAFLLSVLWLYEINFKTWILIYKRRRNGDELRTQSSFQTTTTTKIKMLNGRSFYNINNLYLFWGSEQLFHKHPSMSCYKEKKQRYLANRHKSIKS